MTGRVYGVARCTCEVRVYYGVHQVRPIGQTLGQTLGRLGRLRSAAYHQPGVVGQWPCDMQSDEAWWYLCNVSVAADGTFSYAPRLSHAESPRLQSLCLAVCLASIAFGSFFRASTDSSAVCVSRYSNSTADFLGRTCIGPTGRLVDGKPRPYFHLNRRSAMAMAKKQCKQATLPEDAYVCIRVTAGVWSEESTEESMAMLHGFSAPIDIKTGRQFRSINAASSSPQVVPTCRAGLPSIPFQADATPSIVHVRANHPCGTAIAVRAGERTPTRGEGAEEGCRVDGMCRRDTQAACCSPRGVPRAVAAVAMAERDALQRLFDWR